MTRSEHKRYSSRRRSKQNHDEKPKTRDTLGDHPRGQARIWGGHHVTNRALGSEVWSQGETNEDIYQGEADEDI